MYISYIFLYTLVLRFDFVLSSIPDGDLLYRISQTQLNKLAPIMYENPREYFVHGFVDVCQDNIQTIVTSPYLVEPEKDISVILLDRTSVNVTITYKRDLNIRAMYTVSRRSDAFKVNRSVECQIKNAVFTVNANVGVYKTLRFSQKTLNGTVTGSEFLKEFLSETCVRKLLSKVVFELIRHKIDSIFQITYEYPDTQTDMRFLKRKQIHISMYTVAQQVDIPEFWDIKSFVLWQDNTIPRLPPSIPFPVNLPQVDDAKRFEVWISEKGIHKLWDDLAQSFVEDIENKLQTFLNAFAERKTGHQQIMAEDIFFLPKIAQVFPNSTIDVLLTKLNMWTTINKKSIYAYVDLSLDVRATLACKEKNTTFNVFSIDMNLQFPIQLGVNNFRLNVKVLNFGGTVTIRHSTIGMIKNDFYANTLFLVPRLYGEKLMKDFMVSIRSIGIEVYKTVRDEFVLSNISLRLEEGYAVFEADVVPSQFHNETEGEYRWVGYYDVDDWKIMLNDTTPLNDTGMAIQHCTPSTSHHSSVGEVASMKWLILGIFIGTLVLKE
ncbi:hypothetical protein ACJMK2_010745 [Sinanodonta woodiana]|uniref:Lipid-binding serum glycoprotein C-terminal domain-containing protein n=1 Tax=Sinanodonta woodiana TaxID=1069815 RepID=A0ABD3VJG8_SINWO